MVCCLLHEGSINSSLHHKPVVEFENILKGSSFYSSRQTLVLERLYIEVGLFVWEVTSPFDTFDLLRILDEKTQRQRARPIFE